MADSGAGGHLVTKDAYKDVEIYAEFWADHTTNSGIFLRAQDPQQIGFANSYEVNCKGGFTRIIRSRHHPPH